LGMALDEPKENDEVFKEDGVTFIVNKELFDSVKPISVEFVEGPQGRGFAVKSSLNNKESCCGSCSC
jgi:iron-sulfur cluster assembly protein